MKTLSDTIDQPKKSSTLPLDWVGSILGLCGAFLLSLNLSFSHFGWLFFLVSNAAWIGYACKTRQQSLLIMQAGFTATSLLGIYRWLS